jgi:Flp pilus assembly protein CpaB
MVEKDVPADQAPADAITTVSEAVGMAYRVPLVIGQPLRRSNLETPGLRNDIAEGKRAIALPVNEVSSMSGLVQDGDYIDVVFNARVNLVRVLPTDMADMIEGEGSEAVESSGVVPFGEDVENYPLAGEDGTIFVVRDDLGEAEAVAKIMLQDIRILRVVRPGDQFLADGSRATGTVAEGTEQSAAATTGQVILEVTPEQAEFVNFIQDQHHTYQLIVRGKDDHTKVNTSGITYDLLVAGEEWGLPYPKSIALDDEGNVISERGSATPIAAEGDETEASTDEEAE